MDKTVREKIFGIAKWFFPVGILISFIIFCVVLFSSFSLTINLVLIGIGLLLIFIPILVLWLTEDKEEVLSTKETEMFLSVPEVSKAGGVFDIIKTDMKKLDKYIDYCLRDVK